MFRVGYLVVIVCFALPWIGLECGGPVKIYSGLDLLGEGGPGIVLLLALIAALAGLLATWKIFGKRSTQVVRAAGSLSPLLWAIGMLLFLNKLGDNFGMGLWDTVVAVGKDMVKKPQWTYGLWGVILGYILTALADEKTAAVEGEPAGKEVVADEATRREE